MSKRSFSHSLSLEEAIDRRKKIAKASIKLDRKIADAGWGVVECSGFILKNTVRSKSCPILDSRSVGLVDIFHAVFGGLVVGALSPNEPNLFFVYAAWRMVCYGSSFVAPERNHFQELYLHERRALGGKIPPQNSIGVHEYLDRYRQYRMSRHLARFELSQQWSKIIHLGDSVALDEKLRKFSGQSAHYHVNNAKPDRGGHQCAQLVTRLDKDNITFLMGLYPFDGDYFGRPEDARAVDIAVWCCSLVGLAATSFPGPIIVNDCYYSTEAARQVYIDNQKLFIMAQKCSWMGGLERMFEGSLTHRGEFKYAWNARLGEVCCAHWLVGHNEKKTYTISNAFKKVESETDVNTAPPVYSHYALTFKDCDYFNQSMANNWWPFRPSDEDFHWDSMFFSMACMNAYQLAQYYGLAKRSETFKAFVYRLGLLVLGNI